MSPSEIAKCKVRGGMAWALAVHTTAKAYGISPKQLVSQMRENRQDNRVKLASRPVVTDQGWKE